MIDGALSWEERERLPAGGAFEAIWEWTLATGEVIWSRGAADTFGYLPDELGGVAWWKDHIHPDDLARVLRAVDEALATSAPGWRSEYRFRRKDGSWAWVAGSALIQRDVDGRPVRSVGAMIDVSRLKQVQGWLRLFTDQLPARACAMDRDLRVVLDMGGGFSDHHLSAVGKTVPELFATHPDRDRVLDGCRRVLAGDSCKLDIDDGTSAALLELTPFRDVAGNVIGVVGLALDVTERVRAEEELDRRLAQQEAVARLGQDALRGGDLQPLFEEALDLIARSSSVDFGEIAELLPDDTLVLRAALGWKEGLVGRARFPADSGSPCARAMASGAPSIVDECERETRFSVDPLILEQGIVSHVTVLIKGEGRPFGTLSAGTKARRKFTDHDINFLQSMANVLAAALEQKRAVRELDQRGDRLEALSRRLLDAQEAERRAIARELHDDFGAMLSALKLNLQNDRRGADSIAENLALVDQAIQQVRDLASDLRPSILDDLGLAAAVTWYADREARRAGLELRLDVESIDRTLSATVETACFRIVQEALTNAIRHSGAKGLEVQVHARADAVRVCVRDDGKGFDVETVRRAAAAGRSHGLLNMQERAELAGGRVEMDSGPGLGTTIRVTFRVSQERVR